MLRVSRIFDELSKPRRVFRIAAACCLATAALSIIGLWRSCMSNPLYVVDRLGKCLLYSPVFAAINVLVLLIVFFLIDKVWGALRPQSHRRGQNQG